MSLESRHQLSVVYYDLILKTTLHTCFEEGKSHSMYDKIEPKLLQKASERIPLSPPALQRTHTSWWTTTGGEVIAGGVYQSTGNVLRLGDQPNPGALLS